MVLAALGPASLFAAPASASVARVQHHPGTGPLPRPGFERAPFDTLEYDAAAGEANVVSISFAGGIVVSDSGASVQADTGCTQLGPQSVRCAASYANVRTGDGADRVEVRPPTASIDTGDGDDEVILHGEDGGGIALGPGADKLSNDGLGKLDNVRVDGGPGNDLLAGGPGGDTIYGGPGSDSMTGSTGDDTFAPGSGRDTVEGGGGRDEVSYAAGSVQSGLRTQDVAESLRIDLPGRRATGSGGKEDRLGAIELAAGGPRADVLLGTAGPNTLVGGRGDDRLFGRRGADLLSGDRGDDTLSGGGGKDELLGEEGNDVESGGRGADKLGDPDDSGRDRFRGGSGNDRFETADGRRDRVACGGGRDIVEDADIGDRLAGSCEVRSRRRLGG